jgi:hypothetical protein
MEQLHVRWPAFSAEDIDMPDAVVSSQTISIGAGYLYCRGEATMLANLTRYSDQARGARALNTIRAIRADTAVFTAWCSGVSRTSLPAGADTVAAFVDAMGEVKAPATVRRYVASISHF